MKVVNIVLGILILILALVSTVFSFFLFEKRTCMVDGWDKMATAISSASADMDKKNAVTKDVLAHEKYTSSDMDRNMTKFSGQSKKVLGQRNDMAEYMQEIAKTLKMKEAPNAEQIIAAEEDDPVSAKTIKDKAVNAVKERDKAKKEVREFRTKFGEIGRIVNASDSGDPENVVSSVRSCKRNLDTKTEDLKQTKKELGAVKSERNRIEQERDDLKRELNSANRKNADLEKKLEETRGDYKRLTGTEYGEIPLWKDGSDEARAKVVGKVIEVDREKGYIVVDLNSTLRVTQKVGKRELKVDPKLVHGLEMVVCRGDLDSKKDVQFIARIKIDSIDASCMVANIPANAGKKIKVGDLVINNDFYEKSLKRESK